MTPDQTPRVVIAGLSGDSGKSLVSLGLIRHLVQRGMRVAPFKKGPDYIDAAWLGLAAGAPGRNLDTFLMDSATVQRAFAAGAVGADVAVIEGNRGLYDGMTARGDHATAVLARLLRAPVILVVKVSKVTRTAAAMVLGCQALDPELNLAGVILNEVGTARQEAVIRKAVRDATGIPVVGAIPRLRGQHLPTRHLGLVTASEHGSADEVLEHLAEVTAAHVDTEAVLSIASTAPPLPPPLEAPGTAVEGPRVTIGGLRDKAFSFYYPENLEALERAGARLVFVSPLTDPELPGVDALYAGGGFPEVYPEGLASNEPLRRAIAAQVADGLPVWAECGGLMYLARSIHQNGARYPMVGVLPFAVEQTRRPQGHGYVRAVVDGTNPYLPVGLGIRGHEFHYSRVVADPSVPQFPTVWHLERGAGVGGGRDGVSVGSVFASYTHLHALGTPEWAPALVRMARGHRPDGT